VATFISTSAVETQKLGQRFAEDLAPGDVVALTGELGSGKTQFVKGVVRALGSEASVTSPTFTLVHEYDDGRMPVYHFDFFRIENARAAARLGLDDYFFGNGISIVEWADRFPKFIPENAQWISFETKSENERTIKTAT
jgi:tRNA threonylcarbamoyladenosine biosynthesis protein TsaE